MPQLLARAGTAFNGQALTPEMIQDVVASWPQIERAPLTFGHPVDQSAPKAGNVTGLQANNDYTELYGDIEPLDAVQDAVDGGFFDDRSVGIARGPEGYYLHHVALLGGMPPAIKAMPALQNLGIDFSDGHEILNFDLVTSGSAPAQFSDTILARILEAEIDRQASEDGQSREAVITAMAQGAGESEVTTNHVLRGDIPNPTDAQLEAYASALGISKTTLVEARWYYADSAASRTHQTTTPIPTPTPPTATQPDDQPRFADDPEYQRMNAELQQLQEDRRDAEVEAVRQAASGKMPSALVEQFAAFAGTLADDVAEFSDPSGETLRLSPRKQLAAMLGQLPDLVAGGGFHFSDDPEPDGALNAHERAAAL